MTVLVTTPVAAEELDRLTLYMHTEAARGTHGGHEVVVDQPIPSMAFVVRYRGRRVRLDLKEAVEDVCSAIDTLEDGP